MGSIGPTGPQGATGQRGPQGPQGATGGPLIINGFSYTYTFTNQVGSFNDNANYFDVFPPAGKTMQDLRAFIPSIAFLYFAGSVDANDAIRCVSDTRIDRIRVYVQNTEQRSNPGANWIAVWS